MTLDVTNQAFNGGPNRSFIYTVTNNFPDGQWGGLTGRPGVFWRTAEGGNWRFQSGSGTGIVSGLPNRIRGLSSVITVPLPSSIPYAVSYTHLTLPTNREV